MSVEIANETDADVMFVVDTAAVGTLQINRSAFIDLAITAHQEVIPDIGPAIDIAMVSSDGPNSVDIALGGETMFCGVVNRDGTDTIHWLTIPLGRERTPFISGNQDKT